MRTTTYLRSLVYPLSPPSPPPPPPPSPSFPLPSSLSPYLPFMSPPSSPLLSLARKSGGEYFKTSQSSPKAIADALGALPFSFISATYDKYHPLSPFFHHIFSSSTSLSPLPIVHYLPRRVPPSLPPPPSSSLMSSFLSSLVSNVFPSIPTAIKGDGFKIAGVIRASDKPISTSIQLVLIIHLLPHLPPPPIVMFTFSIPFCLCFLPSLSRIMAMVFVLSTKCSTTSLQPRQVVEKEDQEMEKGTTLWRDSGHKGESMNFLSSLKFLQIRTSFSR